MGQKLIESSKENFQNQLIKSCFIEYTMSRKVGDILLVWLTP